MGFMSETFSRERDRVFSASLKNLAQKYVGKFATIEDLAIDSSLRSMKAEILLLGEKEPFTFRIDKYEIVRKEGVCTLVMHKVSASREWVESLARNYLEGRALRIPSPIARVLTLLS